MKAYRSNFQVFHQSRFFIGLVLVLAFSLAMFGCATAPAVEEAPDSVAAVPEDSETEVAPEPDVAPEPSSRTEYLLSRERSFRGDGRLDSYRELIYEPSGTGLLEELRYTADGRLLQARRYELMDGRQVEERLYNEENQLRAIREYAYDQQGNLTMVEQLDSAEEFQTRSTYGYDAEGRRTSWQVFTSFAGLMGSTAYIYDNSNLVRIESLSPAGDLEEYFAIEVDNDGRQIRRTQYDDRDRRLGYVEYEYEGNTLVRETVRRATGAVQRSVHYEYDDNGNIIVETHFDASGNPLERLEREFITREVQE